ncbi:MULTISPECIES: DUF4007 family protein [Ignatzschineria]|nr:MULTISPECIES: DUF4007 family protein [Ignatzschineria]
MLRIPQQDVKRPIFSGHETFPMRYGWLKKSFDALKNAEERGENAKDVFSANEAIAQFGVGKNMVGSMRHWCNVSGLVDDNVLTDFAKEIFDDNGFDPFLENPMTLWILHYTLATNPQLVTYYWYFNINNSLNLDRKTLQNEVVNYCNKEGYTVPSATTLKRDVECIIRLYMYRASQNTDNAVESPLTELSLIVPIHKQGFFASNRGAKPTLPAVLFWSAVFQCWKVRYENQKTLSLSVLAYEPLSPGRVFLLDENSIVSYIYETSDLFKDQVEWSETAGLRQLALKGRTQLEHLIEKCDELVREVYRDGI